jgi:hypothetical protein
MTYASPIWEYVADGNLSKLQRQQNRVIRAVGKLARCTLFPKIGCDFKNSFNAWLHKLNYAGHKQKQS